MLRNTVTFFLGTDPTSNLGFSFICLMWLAGEDFPTAAKSTQAVPGEWQKEKRMSTAEAIRTAMRRLNVMSP
jgi:hypothetical protein